MSSLMDSLPEEKLKEIISSQIQPGAVFFISDQIAQKNKFIVILGIGPNKIMVGTLFVNSEINYNVIRTLDQQQLQFKIKSSDYEFLDHDSYINASLIHKRDFDALLNIIIVKKGRWMGRIIEKDFDNIRSIMAVSPEITTIEKREFGLI